MKENTKAEVAEMDQFDYEYWAKHFKVSVDELKTAINEVGNSTGELEKYFKR